MEQLNSELFKDPKVEEKEGRIGGIGPNICATTIGGGVTVCLTNPGGDTLSDTGP